MHDRERLRRMVELVNDNIVKAHYFKTIGDLKSAQDWAAKEFEQNVSPGLFSGATKIKREYELPSDKTRSAAGKVIDKLIESDNYEYAARLMKEFGFLEQTFVDTAVKAFNRCFRQMRYKKAWRVEMEFSLPLARIQPPVINMFKHALENGVQITEKSVPACCFQSFFTLS